MSNKEITVSLNFLPEEAKIYIDHYNWASDPSNSEKTLNFGGLDYTPEQIFRAISTKVIKELKTKV